MRRDQGKLHVTSEALFSDKHLASWLTSGESSHKSEFTLPMQDTMHHAEPCKSRIPHA